MVNFTNSSNSINTCYSLTTWSWSFPGGSPTTSNLETPPAITYATNGSYTATLIVRNESGADTSFQQITVSSDLPVTLTPDLTICLGSSTDLEASGAENYMWAPGAIAGDSINVAPDITTTYIVTGTTASGCIGTASVTVTVVPGIDAQVTPAASICLGDSLLLVASGGETYEWLASSGLEASSNDSVVAHPQESITYEVLISGNGCAAVEKTVSITVVPIPPAPVLSDDAFYCQGQQILPVSATNAGESEVNWYSDPGLVNPVFTGPVFTPDSESASYYVTLSDGSCVSDPSEFVLTIDPINVVITANTDSASRIPFDLIAFDQSSGSENCNWFLNDSSIVYNSGDVISLNNPGNYELKLVCISQAGCKDSASIQFTLISNLVELVIPNAFSPDKDGFNDLFEFKINGITTIAGTIYNRWGTEIYKWEGLSSWWDGTVNGAEATDGTYFYTVSLKDIQENQTEKHGVVTLIRK